MTCHIPMDTIYGPGVEKPVGIPAVLDLNTDDIRQIILKEL